MILTTPLLFAFAAGMVATVNPCGFAMLPAYISIFLGGDEGDDSSPGVVTGLRVGVSVTIGFLVLFSVVGLLISIGLQWLLGFVPWAALAVGIALFALGVAVLRGYHLTARVVSVKSKKGRSFLAMSGFGVAFGTASISCTIPIFLAVVGLSTRTPNLVYGWLVFVAYAAGMGVVLTAIAVALATSREVLVTRMRNILPYVERIGGWLLVLSGLFITYYWGILLSVRPGQDSILYRPIAFMGGLSAWFTNSIGNAPIRWAGAFVAVIVVIGAGESVRRRRRQAEKITS
ncbi:MAG: cytochrome c biogenesis CcdA family protein [Acidimicrobiia bacterium]|nr:MAG: cytochrome c biogenesis CcdA family protein [Acidimicrobiia bacterium]